MNLKVAAVAISYYEWTSRPLNAGNIEWEPHLKNFSVQCKYIQDLKKNDDATLPKISKTLSIVKWFEAYEYYDSQVIGQSNAPLTWIIRENVSVATIVPKLYIVNPH